MAKERKTREEKIAAIKKAREVRRTKKRKRKTMDLMKAGQRHGHLVLIQRVRAPRDCSPATRKRWRCRCEGPIEDNEGNVTLCNKEITIPEMYMRRLKNPKLDCGCQGGSLRSRYNNEYRIWLMIRERTRNPSHVANKHYVSRGIDICDEWYDLETGFELWFKEIGIRPSKEHSVDRIDNVRGYEPGNLRWATSAQQRANQGDMVAGYNEEDIVKAGYAREEFTSLIAQGADEHELIKKGKQ